MDSWCHIKKNKENTHCVRTILAGESCRQIHPLFFYASIWIVGMYRRAHEKRCRRWCRRSAGKQTTTTKHAMYRRVPHVQATLAGCTAPTSETYAQQRQQ
ncbi:unnamed protein product [Ectocarpus sp. 12 AP-2014]